MTALLPVLLLAGTVSGLVFDDADGNGRQDAGERGLPSVVVSDGHVLAVSGANGRYELPGGDGGHVFVVLPGDRRSPSGWYRPRAPTVDFALAPWPVPSRWRFAHLSDCHLNEANQERLKRALALAGARGADFAVISGDLVKDSLRVPEAVARPLFDLYRKQIGESPVPVWSVLGNHDVFGIERDQSGVPETHPFYGKVLYESLLGPRYYAFNRGRVHFLVLDTIGVDDRWYYGFLDPAQLKWIQEDLAHLPPGTPVVTVGHIPLRSGQLFTHFVLEGPARTLLTVNGQNGYRHVVRNAAELQALLKPYPWTLALQGHTHTAERLLIWDGGRTRYHTAPAIVQEAWAPGPSGLVVYQVTGGEIDDGELIELP